MFLTLDDMDDPFCACIYKTFVDAPVSTWSTILEFLISVVIGVCGVIVNYRFVRKLQEERRSTPLGRKGNVIEPVIKWNCIFQIIYWPYQLLYSWLNQNEVISSEFIYTQSWLCDVLTLALRFGRITIAYNSMFVALIRYLYIVHQKKANQWEFQNVAKHFIFASVSTPLIIETIGTLTNPFTEYLTKEDLESCVDFWQDMNTTQTHIEIPVAKAYEFTTYHLPKTAVDIVYNIYAVLTMILFLNIIDGFLYFRMFQTIKRWVLMFIPDNAFCIFYYTTLHLY